ncbi:NADP-dependent oxidoreductase domain-containing protein [Armillaria borealis]|uniref:NADP-dependent oxidoreductase domain-containing protein n=1 Tax=Armillaria borealis TaxID=47425 RepID=A0AA39MWS8_9AGAR|nr:NADP-dependent oxidoreductase domain-containing protein [Armillaria borealis]
MAFPAKIIYGTAWKKERTTDLVVSAVLNGFKAIDTACQPKHYRLNALTREDLVGNAMQTLKEVHGIERDQLFIQTKFTSIDGQDRSKSLPYDPSATIPEQVRTSFEKSLANLRTAYIDSYLLHSPLRTIQQTLEAWRVLITLQDEGKIRMIGVSNTYDVGVLRALGQERQVQVVQNRWYEGNAWDQDVVRYCKTNGVAYQSFWTLTGSPSLLSHPSVLAISAASAMTPAQVLYGIVQMGGILPLSGTTNEVHMKEDVAVESSDLVSDDKLRSHADTIKRLVGLES